MLLHKFNSDDTAFLDALLADILGARLYTPAEMLGRHENFIALRAADDYPALSDLLGKIIVIYHYDRFWGTTEAYAAIDPAFQTQKMFLSSLQFYDGNEDDWWQTTDVDEAYACFAIDNWASSPVLEENARQRNMLMRSRSDYYPWHSGDNEEAAASAAFILSTDYPPRAEPGEDPHVFTFEGGATVAWRKQS